MTVSMCCRSVVAVYDFLISLQVSRCTEKRERKKILSFKKMMEDVQVSEEKDEDFLLLLFAFSCARQTAARGMTIFFSHSREIGFAD